MDDEARARSTTKLVLLLALAALCCVGFLALGVWQVQRLAWKEALIAHVDRQLHAAPVPPPGPAQWPVLQRENDEYLRVAVHGRFAFGQQVLVDASTVLGPGFWVITPMQLADGSWLLVNRGFVPPELRTKVPNGPAEQSLVGLLRFTEPGGRPLRHNDPAAGRWFSRDVVAIAAAQGLLGRVAPYFVDAEARPEEPRAWPRAGLTVVTFPNNHLMYALTWFALAAMMLVAIGYLLVDERRLRRLARDPALGDRPS